MEIAWESVDWIHLAQDKNVGQALGNTIRQEVKLFLCLIN
jgi:hypothetical protein